ncbi:M48 family metallopeptidase [Sphingomonas colocasiae]|uniref:M48 family metallopeptidase n=1 Tax=Sphingomonas colocasiae TaxID=1848973 RepID=A0ABS7PMU0_9SPHN|nr:M48 family metallopeptidase [Sphingomonas colocasiae]MBY8822304.1 M48 family metallopeptidase [Sphingomonas colocasiae]
MRHGRTMIIAGAALAMALPALAHAQGFDVEAATRAYVDTLHGAARAKSDAYFEGGYWMILWGALVSVATCWILLRFGLSARFRDWAERRTKRPALVAALYALPYIVTATLITLPWTIYAGYVREKHYDLMSQDFSGWAGEQAIGLGIGIVTTALLLAIIFTVIRRAPRLWWLLGAGAMTVFIAIGLLIAPVFIAPLFNTYSEMPAGPVRDRIVAMAAANHVPAEHIYVFDASKQSKRISANVSGLGPTIRISLNDNLLNRASPPEIAAVMGHELGHYVLRHIWWLIGMFGLLFLAGFWLVHRIAPALIARHGPGWRVRGVDDPAATPVFFGIATVLGLLATPITNSMIRTSESAADAFGLDAAREPDGFALTAMKLSEYRKISPGPIEEMLFFDHPSGETRVRMAMRWKADHMGEAPAK